MISADRIITDGKRLKISLFAEAARAPMLEITSPMDPASSINIAIDNALGLDLLSNSELTWLIHKNKYIKSWTAKCQADNYSEELINYHNE